MSLSETQIRRYSRHILLPDVGGTGQARLLAATVAIDLATDPPAATIAATYLAAAGIGTIVLTPFDPTLAARLTALNPDVRFPDTPAPEGRTYQVGPTGYDLPGRSYLVRGGMAATECVQRILGAA